MLVKEHYSVLPTFHLIRHDDISHILPNPAASIFGLMQRSDLCRFSLHNLILELSWSMQQAANCLTESSRLAGSLRMRPGFSSSSSFLGLDTVTERWDFQSAGPGLLPCRPRFTFNEQSRWPFTVVKPMARLAKVPLSSEAFQDFHLLCSLNFALGMC